MKIANLYAGIGGNRKLWGDKHEITAVEIVPEIAQIYRDLYPNDNIIIGDAHEFLRKNFKDFDFIWASPPCPTHSRLQFMQRTSIDRKYPDMTLYQEIILLKTFFKGKWVIENVKPYYSPLISPTFTMDRHYFWSSDFIMTAQFNNDKSYTDIRNDSSELEKELGFDLSKYRGTTEIRKVLRNCVRPEVGLYIFEQITGEKHE